MSEFKKMVDSVTRKEIENISREVLSVGTPWGYCAQKALIKGYIDVPNFREWQIDFTTVIWC